MQQLHILEYHVTMQYIDETLRVLIWMFILFSMKRNKQQPNRDRKRGEGGALN